MPFNATKIRRVELSPDKKQFIIEFLSDGGSTQEVSMPALLMDTLFLCLSKTSQHLQSLAGSDFLSHPIHEWHVSLSPSSTDAYLTFRVEEGYEITVHMPRTRLPDFVEAIELADGKKPEGSGPAH